MGKMVGVARIELATPAMSTQCSTTELHAHSGEHLGGSWRRRNPVLSLSNGLRAKGKRRLLEPTVLVLGLEHPVDFHDQVLEVERLRQKLRFRSRPAALQSDRRK